MTQHRTKKIRSRAATNSKKKHYCQTSNIVQQPKKQAITRNTNPLTIFRMKISGLNPLITLLCATQALGFSQPKPSSIDNRRNFLATTIATAFTIPLVANADIEGVATPSFSQGPATPVTEEGVKLYSTKSGLKYIILKEGASAAPSPKYGQLVTVSYKNYIKLPNSDLQKYDSDKAYLMKHGNGRTIPGLDEGLHTMKLGEKRRIIIPPKLGYVGPGVLGPLPASAWGRYQLNKLLEQMIEAKAGSVVVDIELKSIMDDEADQGYYGDDSMSPDEFNRLRDNLTAKARENRDRNRPAVDLIGSAGQFQSQ